MPGAGGVPRVVRAGWVPGRGIPGTNPAPRIEALVLDLVLELVLGACRTGL